MRDRGSGNPAWAGTASRSACRAGTTAARARADVHRAGDRDPRGVAPQPLEAVELALVVLEDVHDDVDEVHQDPIRNTTPFHVLGFQTVFVAHALLDRVGDGEDLS